MTCRASPAPRKAFSLLPSRIAAHPQKRLLLSPRAKEKSLSRICQLKRIKAMNLLIIEGPLSKPPMINRPSTLKPKHNLDHHPPSLKKILLH
mmetsp:Transcript_33568/g.51627  ORF Transcript_33568/g.51627 Transcript_33568/m.51627 type:complete len:92 (+) Transcript_33568:626-901(+)